MRQAKLSEITEVITRGISPKYTTDSHSSHIVLNQKCIRDGKISLEFSRLHDNVSKPVTNTKYIREGDILVNSTGQGTLGRTSLVENQSKDILVDSHITIIRPKFGLFEPKYFAYLISKCEKDFIKMSTGTSGQTELPSSSLREYEVAFEESLYEQKRIVNKLTFAFERIDKAILQTKLNISNSNTLFHQYRNRVFKSLELKASPIGEYAVIQSGGTPSKKIEEYWKDGTINWFSSGELNNKYAEVESAAKITKLGLENSSAKIFPAGSLLIGMYDTAAMKMSILRSEASFNQAIAGIKPNEKVSIDYLYHALNYVKPKVLQLRVGIRQQNLNLSKIQSIEIPLPEINTQVDLANKLDMVMDKSIRIQNLYTEKIDNLLKLKNTLLNTVLSEGDVE